MFYYFSLTKLERDIWYVWDDGNIRKNIYKLFVLKFWVKDGISY